MHRNYTNSIDDNSNILIDNIEENSTINNEDNTENNTNTAGKYKYQPLEQLSLYQYLAKKKDDILNLLNKSKQSYQQ